MRDKKIEEPNQKKICFVIMPIGEFDGYEKNHFKRVYEHFIKPSIEKAGFEARRSDDIGTSTNIMIDVIKEIYEADMVVCDLSSKNPNVLYELGIRQAFNLPVTLIKDRKTSRIFDIQGIRDFEYDENLRVDNVKQQIRELSDRIRKNYDKKDEESNSIIKLLGIQAAEIKDKKEVSSDTILILDEIRSMGKRISKLESFDDISRERRDRDLEVDDWEWIGDSDIHIDIEKAIRELLKNDLGTNFRIEETDGYYNLYAKNLNYKYIDKINAILSNNGLNLLKL